MNKKIKEILKNKDYLLEEPEVESLIEYCEELEDRLIDCQFEKEKNKETILLDMIREILKGCNAIEKEEMEHERFGYDAPNYSLRIKELKEYIIERCREERIWL